MVKLDKQCRICVYQFFSWNNFRIKFNKQFLAIPQSGKFSSQNARITNLLQAFNLTERLYLNSYEAIRTRIDYSVINHQMKLIQDESPFVRYIKKEIENDCNP